MKPSETILKILKDTGVELTDEIALEVRDRLDEHVELTDADRVLADGQIAIDESKYKQEKADLAKQRRLRHESEERVQELESTLNAGESQLRKENELLKTKLKNIEPQFTSMMDTQRERWNKLAEKVPESAQEFFQWPVDESSPLSDAHILSNLREFDKMASLGVEGFVESSDGGPPPALPKGSPTGKTGTKTITDITKQDDVSALFEEGYKNVKTRSGSGEGGSG